ncbi:PDR/VanB family oxidoreductase [Nostocoides japonicum]|nr:PDR/VanB family oxidoreductase [Tetrasphaera japonica]
MRDHVKAELVATERLGVDVASFTFAATDGSFVDCEAGAHVDVHLPNGLTRTYSLTDWTPDGRRLSLAVKREPGGRGGSVAMHTLDAGAVLHLSQPRNRFPMRSTDQDEVVLLGGGIGITPLYAMARSLRAAGRPFEIRYLVRTRSAAAFDARLRALDLGGDYRLHCDDEDGILDLPALLGEHGADAHYYVCGPEVMLAAALAASERLHRGTIFFERFAAAPADLDRSESPTDEDFVVALASSGRELLVPAGTSILQVLREAGHDVDYACSEGACGTCITDVVEGEIDHRDSILTDEEREAGDCLCICVSRARCPRLVLDL